MKLEELTAQDFMPLLQQTFTVMLSDGEPYPLALTGVQEFPEQAGMPNQRRPFSLYFSNPLREAYLPQQIYILQHPQMGLLEVFMVPLGPVATGMQYEVIFS